MFALEPRAEPDA